jgi:hypothetical protein
MTMTTMPEPKTTAIVMMITDSLGGQPDCPRHPSTKWESQRTLNLLNFSARWFVPLSIVASFLALSAGC